MTAWTKLANQTATISRASIAGGKRGAPATHLSDLSITPLWPVGGELVQRFRLDTATNVFEGYIVGSHDIQTGDQLAVGDETYTIKGLESWTPPDNSITEFTRVVVEKVWA